MRHAPVPETNDLVVFGHVETLDYEPIDELAMNARITARLTITRVVSGRPPSAVLTIKYIAHSDLARDRDFRFRLQRSEDGGWVACNDEGARGYICR